MEKTLLEEAGLSKGESDVYQILLKLGEASATDVAKQTKIARPNVYDYLHKLKEKGFVSFITRNNKRFYVPASPERVLEFLDEKRDLINKNIGSLLALHNPKKEAAKVEVFEGSEGFKTIMNDIIKTKSEFVGWGGSNKVHEYVPRHVVERYISQREKYNIKAKLLYVETEGVLKTPKSTFKSIPQEYTSPSTTLVYKDRVVIMIYTPIPVIIRIISSELAESYNKHFKLLWKNHKS